MTSKFHRKHCQNTKAASMSEKGIATFLIIINGIIDKYTHC